MIRGAVADGVQPLGIVTAQYAIVDGLKFDPVLFHLLLGVFVSVEAQLGIVGKVGAELQKERSKVTVHAVDVESVSPWLWSEPAGGKSRPSSRFAAAPSEALMSSLAPCR